MCLFSEINRNSASAPIICLFLKGFIWEVNISISLLMIPFLNKCGYGADKEFRG